MRLISTVFRLVRSAHHRTSDFFCSAYTHMIFLLEGAKIQRGARIRGLPLIRVSRYGGKLSIGRNFRINSGHRHNLIGRQQKSMLIVGKNAELVLGDNVGMSSTAIICHHRIIIGSNVLFGGNVVVYDSDFHILDPLNRRSNDRLENAVSKPVKIDDNVFIGAHSTILKGVHVGENAVIGASSVVTRSIPANELWAGNPARYIRTI